MTESRMTRDEAWAILCEWIQNPNLRKHLLAAEAAMRAYARKFGEDEDVWGIVGLLHDLDYERHPSQDAGHPFVGIDELKRRGVPDAWTRAMLSHADYAGLTRETPMEKTLFAVDELVGFITAVALVRPQRSLVEVDVAAVRKKMKDKAFARSVDREYIRVGAELVGMPLAELVALVIAAQRPIAERLGIGGVAAPDLADEPVPEEPPAG
jgi:putative nucleotidyltransferase with HDIG domain